MGAMTSVDWIPSEGTQLRTGFREPSSFDAPGAAEAWSGRHKELSELTTFPDIPFHYLVHCTRVIWTCRTIVWTGVFAKMQDLERHRMEDGA
jgi:hypothetical protein